MSISYFDSLERASFNGIEFPYLEMKVTGGARIGRHVARFRAGAVLEPHARESYEIAVVGIFDSKARGYGDLIAKRQALRRLFDTLATGDLTIPTEGTIRAKAEKWVSTTRVGVRSGVAFEMTFVEDSIAPDFLGGEDVPANVVTIDGAAAQLEAEAKALPVSPGLFDQLMGVVDACLEAKAMVEGAVYLAEGKIRSVLEVMRQIDITAQELQHPEAWSIVDALHDLGGAMSSLAETFGAESSIRTFVVPKTMAVQELSQAIYRDTSHVSDLLNLNPGIEDAAAVPAGLTVRYLSA